MRDAAGRLARQLFDRNSQRPFAPAAAFAAEGVQADRFLAEMRVAAAAPGGLLEAVSSRVSGLLKWVVPPSKNPSSKVSQCFSSCLLEAVDSCISGMLKRAFLAAHMGVGRRCLVQ